MSLANDLEQFYGTEKWYKVNPFTNIVITDGVKYFADKGGAYWAVDDILITVQTLQLPFTVATVTSKDGKAEITYEDGNGNVRNDITAKYPFTDLEEGEYKFYITDGVMLLPSEY
jgi:hypothetical protein